MNRKLAMPENISLRWELMRGFGKAELVRSTVVTVVILILTLFVCRVIGVDQPQFIVVVAVIASIFLCCCFFSKYDGNRSIYDYLRLARRFRSEQQNFKYKSRSEVIEVANHEN